MKHALYFDMEMIFQWQSVSESVFVHFYSETAHLDTSLLIEVWDKGMLWDTKLGAKLVPLRAIRHSNEVHICVLSKLRRHHAPQTRCTYLS